MEDGGDGVDRGGEGVGVGVWAGVVLVVVEGATPFGGSRPGGEGTGVVLVVGVGGGLAGRGCFFLGEGGAAGVVGGLVVAAGAELENGEGHVVSLPLRGTSGCGVSAPRETPHVGGCGGPDVEDRRRAEAGCNPSLFFCSVPVVSEHESNVKCGSAGICRRLAFVWCLSGVVRRLRVIGRGWLEVWVLGRWKGGGWRRGTHGRLRHPWASGWALGCGVG